MRQHTIRHKFVEFMPEQLEEGTLYISVQYASAAHKCCCGCGNDVVTPLSPTDWNLTYDGRTISIFPSIGNWSFPCRSHYWIRNNQVEWARQWSREEIASGRAADRQAKERHYRGSRSETQADRVTAEKPPARRFWRKLKIW